MSTLNSISCCYKHLYLAVSVVLQPGTLKAGFSTRQIQVGCTAERNKVQDKFDLLKIHSRPNATELMKYSWDKRKDDGNGHSNRGSRGGHPCQHCLEHSRAEVPAARSRGKLRLLPSVIQCNFPPSRNQWIQSFQRLSQHLD